MLEVVRAVFGDVLGIGPEALGVVDALEGGEDVAGVVVGQFDFGHAVDPGAGGAFKGVDEFDHVVNFVAAVGVPEAFGVFAPEKMAQLYWAAMRRTLEGS